jgi:hypothetical protein
MPDDEILRLRNRVHKLGNIIQNHDIQLVQYRTMIESMQNQLNVINSTMVNRELLNVTVGQVMSKVEQFHNQNSLRFEHFDSKIDSLKIESLEPIRKALYWAVGLIIGGFILAGMNLLIKTN